ncbi:MULTISPECIES: cobyrinate a,c-diamide synthase [Sulfurospirillum]|uniref:Cobyrinate a,c-diamide synthase n=4 Tax=Sulfurospirillum TaxID=57665 RepID=A0A1Y0HMJ4_9BACT|nr:MULTISPECIES: cobyrinate a,c-diamide synthase [Sulfurospirillum]AHJ12826.1 cobyrinic acid A,C-diamide synthase CbiA [Sulfurospirillum multivorans DSM 12446]AOO65305.1 cobyrinic acid A,C-diamide synthase CbiA [Sulfurospirillum halorespirans DSM 13726]ARU48786.1 Cobyrinate a,c-diamide synthase [Sulfurospirillum diekertiae]ASC93608.1 Cobyrinate a,c-diamide synthase [Sulfurospirillum diekertiae]ATB69652.1 cobyrinic acid A,C-diamide synthase CbiA [Sulfurospirillum diekertiae]
MKKAICIGATKSNDGKTLLTTALLHHFKKDVSAFKCGPDYIDPQFHDAITGGHSVNLDGYLMNEEQLRWTFEHYHHNSFAVIEGVMGFYDGMDKGASAYDVAKSLHVPSVIVVDASGSYITIAAVIKGLLTFRDDHTIKGVILNKVSSSMHFSLLEKVIEEELPHIAVLGWIKKDLITLESTHLGLDLEHLDRELLALVSKEVLEHIDLELLMSLATFEPLHVKIYPFEKIPKIPQKLAIVHDANFSFLYHDNVNFLKEVFDEVVMVSAVNDEKCEADVLYIPGGYVETKEAYKRIENSHTFKHSVLEHAKNKPIYGECAGLIFLGKKIDEKPMLGLLDVEFSLQKRFKRMGYYDADFDGINTKGHAFHYSSPHDLANGYFPLVKRDNGENGVWKKDKVFGTYLHTFFRTNPHLIKQYFS